jgi:cytoskeletal protein CcmA (bactofilin family)
MGNLESKGEVTVEGQIQGDIHCAMLLVGENAQVTGGIIADEVVVRGRVLGSLRGNKVTLQSSAHVEGDIFHRALAIEQGAFFEGKSRRSDDPLSTATRSEAAPLGDILANGSGGGIRN